MEVSTIEEFLSQEVFAIVGASRDRSKYGNKVYRDLREKGFKVYPVNPNTSEVEGDTCYPDIISLPQKPDVVNTVVPPKVTEEIVKQCKVLGINRVWMQPGSESEEAIGFCEENGIKVVHSQCAMVRSRENS